MTYKEIFSNKHMTDEISAQISDAMEELAGDNRELKARIAMALNKGHHCEFTAMHRIMHMVPAACIGPDGSKMKGIETMHEYLSAMGITPEVACKHVSTACQKASEKAREKGFTAPSLDANQWDAYYAMAYVMADYWYTICGSMEKAAMMAYEHLSDPDRKK